MPKIFLLLAALAMSAPLSHAQTRTTTPTPSMGGSGLGSAATTQGTLGTSSIGAPQSAPSVVREDTQERKVKREPPSIGASVSSAGSTVGATNPAAVGATLGEPATPQSAATSPPYVLTPERTSP